MQPLEYINYQSSLPLINRVRETLHSYDSAGMIDEGQFYDWIKLEMQSLGLGYYQDAEVILPVKRYKAAVPKDFVSLYSVQRCSFTHKGGFNSYKVAIPEYRGYIETLECPIKKKPCEGYVYEGKMIRQVHHIEFKEPVYTDYESKGLLRWTNQVSKNHLCGSDCMNLNIESPNEFTLDENFFYFNFDEDSVHVKYYKLAVDEDGLPLIPDVGSAKQAIEKYLIFRLFEQWYYNGEGDMVQRMQYAKLEYERYHSDAEMEVKFPTVAELMEYGLQKQKKNNKFYIPNAAMRKLR